MRPYQIFISYAREDQLLKNRLVSELQTLVHLGLIKLWHDLKIGAGKEYEHEILSNIERSDVFLPLITPHFLRSKFCRQELNHARQRILAKKCRVLPILVSEAPGWGRVPVGRGILGNLQARPPNGVPLTKWAHQDHAWRAVSRGVGEMVLTASGASLSSQDVRARILLTVGTFVFDSIADLFDLEEWQHYYTGDHDAERELYGNVECESDANKLRIIGYDDDFKRIVTVAAIEYEPQFHRFSYSIVGPKEDRALQYRFDLAISMLEGITVEATRIDLNAAEVDPELTLQAFLELLKETFREQMQRYRNYRPVRSRTSNRKKKRKTSTSAR